MHLFYLDRVKQGFTLSELLITLGILGVIATFTIPKILDAGQDQKYNAVAKETIAMVAGAYQNYKLNSTVTANTSPKDLTPYMNYVKTDTSSQINQSNNGGSGFWTCSAGNMFCLRLHNGAILSIWVPATFVNTTSTNALRFNVDADGAYQSTTDSRYHPVQFWLYYDGKVRTDASVDVGTQYSVTGAPATVAATAADPGYFSWN